MTDAHPVPARITAALDLRQLYGPEVDEQCGAQEPDVDMWETGERVPTAAQVVLLAELTGFPVGWFYRPYTTHVSGLVVCTRDGRGRVRCDFGDRNPPPPPNPAKGYQPHLFAAGGQL